MKTLINKRIATLIANAQINNEDVNLEGLILETLNTNNVFDYKEYEELRYNDLSEISSILETYTITDFNFTTDLIKWINLNTNFNISYSKMNNDLSVEFLSNFKYECNYTIYTTLNGFVKNVLNLISYLLNLKLNSKNVIFITKIF